MLEVDPESEAEVRSAYEAQGLSAVAIGSTSADKAVSISVGGEPTIQGKAPKLSCDPRMSHAPGSSLTAVGRAQPQPVAYTWCQSLWSSCKTFVATVSWSPPLPE